jgi:hypothetical protein
MERGLRFGHFEHMRVPVDACSGSIQQKVYELGDLSIRTALSLASVFSPNASKLPSECHSVRNWQ